MSDNSSQHNSSVLVPTLYISDLDSAIDFYKRAFFAVERWRIDHRGRTHVAELAAAGIVFRLHDEVNHDGNLGPLALKGTSTVIGLLVPNPDEIFSNAVASGATVLSPMKDFEYGYRQGTFRDPFGHHWCLEKFDGEFKTPLFS
jgi:PhnB protein